MRPTRWGAILADGTAHFCLWAPSAEGMHLRLRGDDRPMRPRPGGWFEAEAPAAAGDAYGFVLGDGTVVPDPASRWQAGDVHGPSRLADPGSYRWRADWAGRPWHEAVILELHVGAFTPEGSFRAAAERMGAVAETGFTAIELMPVAQAGGRRGWGYDGVLLYAPHSAYGTPDELKALVDAAHAAGLMVLLDVVYNHFGPEGNYLPRYAPEFFHSGRSTPWGGGIAYETPAVRAFFLENALYWLDEYRFDGLRLDAIDHIHDPDSDPGLVEEIARMARAALPDRQLHLTTEDARNITRLHERDAGGAVTLYTAEWNDDWHHAAHVLATGEIEGYYRDFADDPVGHLARASAEGFAFQGERSSQADASRGEPSGHLPPTAFVAFLQNHDQIGNRALGQRLISLAPPETVRALTAILLLAPQIPLMFMGEDWGEIRPFSYFCDFEGPLGTAVRDGRRREFRHFPDFADAVRADAIPDPNAAATFIASRIDWHEAATGWGGSWRRYVQGLLALRQREIVPLLAAARRGGRAVPGEPGVVAVDWPFGGATLRLRANLAADPLPVPAAAGRVIWGPAADAGANVPPQTVIFAVDRETTA